MKVFAILAIALCVLSVESAIPKKFMKHFNGKDFHASEAIKLMKNMKTEMSISGREVKECDEYFKIIEDVSPLQKEQYSECTSKHEAAVSAAEKSTTTESVALHTRSKEVGDKLNKCETLEVSEGLNCLGLTSETEMRTLNQISRDSKKLNDKHMQTVTRADNSLTQCNSDVAYFYSDVVDDIMDKYRACVFYGEKEDYVIPEFKPSE
ncbi:hypothetical protein ACFFRR_007516 [Megaselia abdita]